MNYGLNKWKILRERPLQEAEQFRETIKALEINLSTLKWNQIYTLCEEPCQFEEEDEEADDDAPGGSDDE